MVASSKSVVTPERFATGKTYEAYKSTMPAHEAEYDENYAGTQVSEEQAKAYRELVNRPNGPAKVLVITEDWCPDCYREVPVLARIAEASGMELKVLARDENKDVMAEFRKNGEFDSIPVFVFYTKDHEYITHWIERSRYAEAHIPDMRVGTEAMSREDRAVHNAKFQQANWGTWRQETVKELLQILSSK